MNHILTVIRQRTIVDHNKCLAKMMNKKNHSTNIIQSPYNYADYTCIYFKYIFQVSFFTTMIYVLWQITGYSSYSFIYRIILKAIKQLYDDNMFMKCKTTKGEVCCLPLGDNCMYNTEKTLYMFFYKIKYYYT